jgi:DNA mismatch endonuclease (patch repair protein)
MVDIVSPASRSRMMSGIKAKNSQLEILIRRLLFSAGYRFRLHRRDLPGTPDIVLPGRRIVIFVHGCFWHMHEGCRLAKIPATRPEFWSAKLHANMVRDKMATEKLNASGWRVLYVWECATRSSIVMGELLTAIENWMASNAKFGEISGNGLASTEPSN